MRAFRPVFHVLLLLVFLGRVLAILLEGISKWSAISSNKNLLPSIYMQGKPEYE